MKDHPQPPSETIEHVVRSAGSLVIDCELCGRTHFATLEEGRFDDGELEDLRAKAKKEPAKYVEDPGYDSIIWGKIGGKQAVIGCPCNGLRPLEDFIWGSRHVILKYLETRATERLEQAQEDAKDVIQTKKAVEDAEAEA